MIQDEMPTFDRFDLLGSLKYKELCNKKGMYAYVSWRWLIPFAKWINGCRCLEVMAGAGYLSWALREQGIDVIATDSMEWGRRMNWQIVTPIEELTANQAIWKYGKQVDIVIMAWPFMDEDAYRALRLMHYVNPGALMVYIGEWGGACAEDNFFANFDEIEDPIFRAVAGRFQRFDCINDRMFLGRCKKAPKRVNPEIYSYD